jgi:hypothetical protein
MKRFVYYLFFLIILITFSFHISTYPIFAQSCAFLCSPGGICDPGYTCDAYGVCTSGSWCPSCVGDSGGHGACQDVLTCFRDWQEGQGDCIGSGVTCCVPTYITPSPTITPTPTPSPIPTITPIPSVPPNVNCAPGYHCSMPNVLCDGTEISPEDCQTACENTAGTWIGNTGTCALDYTFYPGGDEGNPQHSYNGLCCAPDSMPSGPNWNEWQCEVYWGNGLCGIQSDFHCSDSLRVFHDNICFRFQTQTAAGWEHPWCEDSQDALTGLNRGYCNFQAADVCYLCGTFPNCSAYDPSQDGYNDCSYEWGMYYTYDECIAGCHNYRCDKDFTHAACVQDDINWEYSGPLARISCEDECKTCNGIFGGQGMCDFFMCPENTYFEGFNPPQSETGCPLLFSCCTQYPTNRIVRNPLPILCTVNGQEGINTAIGCIPVTGQNQLLQFIFPWAIGVAGGTSFLLIIVAGFLIMSSGGDPQKAKAGKELLGAAVAGLVMVIFSVYILDVIGLRIFRFPGL